MSESERNALVDSQIAYHTQLYVLVKELERCWDNLFCIEWVNKQVLELAKACQKSLDDLPSNTALSGTKGSDFQKREKVIIIHMYGVQEGIIEDCRQE